jgi:hypothetical protein
MGIFDKTFKAIGAPFGLGLTGGVTDKFSVNAPEPSSAETGIYNQIFGMIEEQAAYQEAMMPVYLHQAKLKNVDYTPTEEETQIINRYEELSQKFKEDRSFRRAVYQTDMEKLEDQYNEIKNKIETGTYEQMTDDEWYEEASETERKEYDIYQAQLDRYNKALAGEVPLTETMINQKQKEFEQLKASIGTITGDTPESATATDTIGIQNLNEFQKRWQQAEEAQRYGELSTGAQSTLATAGLTSDMTSRRMGMMSGIGNMNAGAMQGYSGLLGYQQGYTQAGYQAQAQNAATRSQMFGSLLNLGGMLGAAKLASSRDYKKNIKAKTKKEEDQALNGIKKTKSYNYQYKNKMKLGKEKHIGSITEESPDYYITKDKKAIDLGDKIEYLSMGIKALARKIDKIESRA